MLSRAGFQAILAPGVFLALLMSGQPAVATDEHPPVSAVRSLRLDIGGGCAVVARPQSGESAGEMAQLLLEKPGGNLHVLATFEGLEFTGLLSADLDGNAVPEVIAIARHRAGDEFMPFIFACDGDFRRIFPPGEGEDNPIIGKEITTIPGKSGTELCVKIPVTIHDFGPPDLFQIETYRLRGKQLEKTGESLTEARHFNQIMNRGALSLQRGSYLEALKEYESVLGLNGTAMRLPPAAKAEALLAAAECRSGLKDFSTALELYRRVTIECPGTPQASKAGSEASFIAKHLGNTAALALYTDILRANRMERWNEALALLDASPNALKSPLEDHFTFQRGEALLGLGRVDEAIAQYRRIRSEFSRSSLAETAAERLQELEGAPETPDEQ
ncbi:MAG TPA: tetratricopeptide repeat protein [Candidatus Ozemobacteraceae bacterium]|nr:tetratricopeptide repeat protein [Candidatus Ozemobacteraceae bacterium]